MDVVFLNVAPGGGVDVGVSDYLQLPVTILVPSMNDTANSKQRQNSIVSTISENTRLISVINTAQDNNGGKLLK